MPDERQEFGVVYIHNRKQWMLADRRPIASARVIYPPKDWRGEDGLHLLVELRGGVELHVILPADTVDCVAQAIATELERWTTTNGEGEGGVN